MSDEIPSPAGRRRPAPRSPEGPSGLPWEGALYAAVAALERRAEAAERERNELLVFNHQLRKALREARGRLENWELRRQAWKRERDELLQRLERLK